MKKTIKKLHLYIALIFLLPFSIQAISGGILVFDHEISDYFLLKNHKFAEGQIKNNEEIAAAAKLLAPSDYTLVSSKFEKVARFRFKQEKQMLEIIIDPVSLETIAIRNPKSGFLFFLKQLHKNLFLEETGKIIIGICGVALLFMSISGLIIWWPKKDKFIKSITIRFNEKGYRFYKDTHKAFGFFFFLSLGLSSFTGAFMAFKKPTPKLLHQLHTGHDINAIWQMITFLTSLSLIIFIITGFLLWRGKKKRPS